MPAPPIHPYIPPKISQNADWPDMGRAYHTVSKEMPDAISGLTQVAPMNGLERLILPKDVMGVTWPWGRVAYNKDAAQAAGYQPEDVLTHELAHVRQNQGRGGGALSNAWAYMKDLATPYAQKPDEQDAFNTEFRMNASRHRGDINLPAEGLKRAKP